MDPEFKDLKGLNSDNKDLQNIKAVNDKSFGEIMNYHYKGRNRLQNVGNKADLDTSDIPITNPITPKLNTIERKLNTPIIVNHKLVSHMKNNPVPNIVVAEHSPVQDNALNKIEELLNKYNIQDKSFDRSISPIGKSK
jgi:hypothetical protein